MARPAVTPRNQERTFGLDELFFSTTDRKGIIRSGNQVFVRVSGHPIERLLGAPHNIIRHPDVPQAVFHLLWSYLDQGKPFAGYVKNMAADGCYYWVLALVVPTRDGYLSVRLKPSSAYFPVVRDLYAELLALEQRVGAETGSWKTGMQAAETRLGQALGALGLASYDDFMRIALVAELSNHRTARQQAAGPARASRPGASSWMLDACRAVDGGLDDLFARAEGLLSTIATLGTAASFLLRLARDIHLISLNALIASHRLTAGGAGLSVVTEDLARLSQECTVKIDGMAAHLRDLSSSLGETAFSVSAAKLQVEMTADFLHELAHEDLSTPDPDTDARIRGDMATLAESLLASTGALVAALPRAQAPIPGLLRLQHELEADLRQLASVHLLGAIQAVGIPDEMMFRELLDRIVTQLRRGDDALDNLTTGVDDLRRHLPVFERTAHEVRHATEAFKTAGTHAA